MEKLITAILEGKAKSAEIADKIAKSYQNCPYVAFLGVERNRIYIVYFLPEKQRWWVETIKEKPQHTLGLERAEVTFPEKLYFPETMKIRLLDTEARTSPCSANCSECPSYARCLGCPSTVHHKGK
jgi:hypothetical protein